LISLKQDIKRDTSVFPTLKDEQFNDQRNRSFANKARAQDVSAVLDASNAPSLPIDTALFQGNHKYLYAVL
jgi:hypothetical protein